MRERQSKTTQELTIRERERERERVAVAKGERGERELLPPSQKERERESPLPSLSQEERDVFPRGLALELIINEQLLDWEAGGEHLHAN